MVLTETITLHQIGGIVLLIGLSMLFWRLCINTMLKLRRQIENKPNPTLLSSLKVGDYFIIVDDEEDLWEVLYFGWQGVLVDSINTGRTEWLKYDLKVQKYLYSRL